MVKEASEGKEQVKANEPVQGAFVIEGKGGKIENVTVWIPKQGDQVGAGMTSDQVSQEEENPVLY